MLEYIYLNTLVDAAQKNKLLNEKKKIEQKKKHLTWGKNIVSIEEGTLGEVHIFGRVS